MCIYTVKNQIEKKKLENSHHQGGCSSPRNVPKLCVSGVKNTAKTN